MGVPTFYRWLCSRYPRVVIDVGDNHVQDMREEIRQKRERERARQETKENEETSDRSAPAAENAEKTDQPDLEEEFGYDCLYLDMNGIIHPCCHTDDGSCPATEEEMFLSIFQYVDRIVDIIQPRKLLYLAIDGVAPRAKMNQQRSRRFKAAKDIQEEEKAYEELKAQFESEGREVPPKKIRWDSNVITPGTPFMHRLAIAITYYIQDRLATRSSWQGLKVIFSDATVPGEGEHKIMDFIRQQRKSGEFRPNLRHVLHGADADLIMLGLATHEANFSILREAVVDRTPEQVCSTCNAVGHSAENCKGGFAAGAPAATPEEERAFQVLEQDKRGLKRHLEERGVELREDWAAGLESHRRAWKPLQMLQLPVLREYLTYEFITQQAEGHSYDLERCIDDFVFLCFLCGNDFLPHLPHQSIQRGSIDALVHLYLHLRPQVLTDYLTHEGRVNLRQLYTFLHHLAIVEKEVKDAEQGKAELSNENAARLLKHQLEARILASGSPNISRSGPAAEAEAEKSALEESGEPRESGAERKDSCESSQPTEKAEKAGGAGEGDAQISKEAASPGEAGLTVGVPERANADEGLFSGDRDGDTLSPGSPPHKRRRGSAGDLSGASPGGILSVPAGKRREEDFDMFKAKLSQKLNREIDGDTLLKDEVDGGVGCPDRSTWRQKYYRQKFHLPEESDRRDVETLASDVALAYIVGLQWVLLYYYQGCNSFDWFFPFHYAPLAVDLADELQRRLKLDASKEETQRRDSSIGNARAAHSLKCTTSRGVSIEGKQISFTLGMPFRAFEQLMAVLPPYSASCLPREHAAVMTNPRSAIADFYPADVKMDPNHQWQWVVLLPFIDENRLLRVCKPLEQFLTLEERERNRRGSDRLFVHRSHPLAETLAGVTREHGQGVTVHDEKAEELDAAEGYSGVRGAGCLLGGTAGMGMTGKLFFNQFSVLPGEDGLHAFPSATFCCFYTTLRLAQPHRSVLLDGVKPYVPILERFDLEVRAPNTWKERGKKCARCPVQDEERKDRAFSGAVARRIVMHCLSSRMHDRHDQGGPPSRHSASGPWQSDRHRNNGISPHDRGRPFHRHGDAYHPGPARGRGGRPLPGGFAPSGAPLLYAVPGGVHPGAGVWSAPGLIPGDPWAQQFARGYARPQAGGLMPAPVNGGYGGPPYGDVRCLPQHSSAGIMGPGGYAYRSVNSTPGYSGGPGGGAYRERNQPGTGYAVDYRFSGGRGGYSGGNSRGGRRGDGRYEDPNFRRPYGR
uniref:GF20490, related n=1 Tax=Neospora caninum (strain Liverpool) TaxID=572307 RepID=F0JB99_NEOCL|nr:GF20490, related [Neospora caninum Liverpool]CEL71366.1 TPA: GF20490, related [Neospora caninum Liverpool]